MEVISLLSRQSGVRRDDLSKLTRRQDPLSSPP